MKRHFNLFVIFFCFYGISAFAQQRPQYTQYVFNNYLLNPAVTGIENYTDVKVGYRSQWTGLQGAPVTSYVTLNTPIGTDFVEGDATQFGSAGGGVNPYSRSYTQTYMAPASHHGIGFMIISDKAGPITQTNIDATYAYHMGLSDHLSLAVGAAMGLYHANLDVSQLTFPDSQTDPAVTNGNSSLWKPDAGAGVWMYTSSWYIGASVQQLIPQTLNFGTTSSAIPGKIVPHFFFTTGVKVFLSDDVTAMPSVMVKVTNPVPPSFDLNMKLTFKDIFWLGAAYRRNDSYALLTGINISSVINVGYSYDITTSNLNTVSNGTHEIVIGVLLNNRYKATCPRYSF